MAKMEIWNEWVGNTQSTRQVVDHTHAQKVAATLGSNTPAPGDPLPACWHWAWFNEAQPGLNLGRDGHPKLGGFLPPVPLPRRMWAGGELEFHAPLLVGKEIEKISQIADIQEKTGKTGKLFIVSVEHRLLDDARLCVTERQNLVYREDPTKGQSPPQPPDPPDGAVISEEVVPDPVLMFRYSALTFNGHRIHYDVDYARNVEGYPGLVFHAPLTATLLADLCCRQAGNSAPASFVYRATSTLYENEPFKISAKEENGEVVAWAANPQGGMAMTARARF